MEAIIRAARISPVARQLQRAPRQVRAGAASAADPEVIEPIPSPLGTAAQMEPVLKDEWQAISAPMSADAARVENESALETLRVDAEREAAALRADAERKGYAAGLERGEMQGQAMLQAQIERVQGLANQLVQAKSGVLAEAEDAMVELAFAALCSVLGEQAATRETVARIVRERSLAAHDREQITIRLHPADFALLETCADGSAQACRCSADPMVVLGGCIVDTGSGTLDARLETQLARLRQILLAARAARGDDQGAL